MGEEVKSLFRVVSWATMKRFHQVLQGLHDWLEAVVNRLGFRISSILMGVGSEETSSTCFCAVTSSIGEVCGISSDEAGSPSDSNRSDVMSGDDDVRGESKDLSGCE